MAKRKIIALASLLLLLQISFDETLFSSRKDTEIKLEQNFPNPFEAQTTIRYFLPKNTDVSLSIYDMREDKRQILVDEFQFQGQHEVVFNGSGYLPGIYFYRLKTDETRPQVKKMLKFN